MRNPVVSPIVLAVLGGALSMVAATPASADYQSGWKAYQRGDYPKARDEFEAAAVAGDPRAALALADMYSRGRTVEIDAAEALRWLGIAADAGHAGTQFALGNRYLDGKGVPRDLEKAKYWFRRAAEQGHPNAQLALGSRLLEDSPTAPEAIAWIERAAQAGLIDARFALADAYEIGIDRDPARAARLRDEAAKIREDAERAQAIEAARQTAEAWRRSHSYWRGWGDYRWCPYHPFNHPHKSHIGLSISRPLP